MGSRGILVGTNHTVNQVLINPHLRYAALSAQIARVVAVKPCDKCGLAPSTEPNTSWRSREAQNTVLSPHSPLILSAIYLLPRTSLCRLVMVKSEVSTSSLSNPALVLVEWQTRTAGFRNTDVATIVQKACAHFGLGAVERQYALMANIDGHTYELTDDTLESLPSGTYVTLSRVSVRPAPAELDDDAASDVSGDTFRSSDYVKPVNTSTPFYKPPPPAFG
ncbi:hypothetical protein C8Q76DRAFT_143644 [Earliella scabrosa]|nr:hypothetical protein C8Q76DRAFT_143644 [Earliella scabrosa]